MCRIYERFRLYGGKVVSDVESVKKTYCKCVIRVAEWIFFQIFIFILEHASTLFQYKTVYTYPMHYHNLSHKSLILSSSLGSLDNFLLFLKLFLLNIDLYIKLLCQIVMFGTE